MPAFNPSGLNFYDFTADQSRFAFSAAGDMGVGVANPTAKLDVAGTVKSTGFTMNVGASLNGKVLTSDANGIGTWQTPAIGGTATDVNCPAGCVETADITDGTITNADINAAAAIAPGKIAGTAATLGANTFTGDQNIEWHARGEDAPG